MDISSERREALLKLAERLGVPNIDVDLLHEALCHSSFANEHEDYADYGNERLEFLGDSVVGLTVTEALYLRFSHLREGELSKIKSIVVSKRILAERTESLDLSEYLLLGKGEEQTGGRNRFSILGNLYESVVGAIYLSQGIEAAKSFVLQQLDDELELAAAGESIIDYKSNLQERTQRDYGVLPSYRLLRSTGPDHDKEFIVQVYVGDILLSEGVGKSKKKAEKVAAKNALVSLGETQDKAEETAVAESEPDPPGPLQTKPVTAIPPEGRILAVDTGEKRIGIALSDELRLISQPLVTIENTNASEFTQRMEALVKEHEAVAVIVGLPRTLSGREGNSASLARKIGDRLRRHLGIPVILWDERLSTVASERHLIESGVRRRDRREIVDQCAAAWILEGYLEYLRQSAVP
ncbi:MAG: ribonuclease III [bacterium]